MARATIIDELFKIRTQLTRIEMGAKVGALLTPTKAARYLGLSKTQFSKIRHEPRFPTAVNVPGQHTPVFRRRDLDRWIDRLTARRRKSQIIESQTAEMK